MKILLLCLLCSSIFFQTWVTGMTIPAPTIKFESCAETCPDFLEMSMTAGWYDLPPWFYGSVYAMSVYDGSLYVAGDFFDAAGIPEADYIARFDGCGWYAVAPGITNIIYEMAFIGEDLYVGGEFENAAGNPNADHIAVLNGGQWNPIGTGLNGPVFAIAGNGNDIYIGGSFLDAGGNPDADRIAKWDGSSWNELGTGLNDIIYTIVIQGNQVLAGGSFTNAGGISNADYIANWENNSWHSLGDGVNERVWNMAVHGSNTYVIGAFTEAGGIASNYIAKWDGANWQNLGDYFQYNDYSIINTITIADDLLYVGVSSESIAWVMEWDIQNSEWTEYPPDYPEGAPIGSIAVDDNYIYVGNIVTFDGGGDGGCYGGFTSHHSTSRGGGGVLRWGEPPPEIIITGVPESICENDLPISLPTIQSGYPGNWSGDGVTNNTFDPNGMNEWVQLTFTPIETPCPGIGFFGITVIQNGTVDLNLPSEICESGIPLELNQEQNGIYGSWSGQGVTNNIFYPSGLNGAIELTFTPYPSFCSNIASETILVVEIITPDISDVPSSVCENSESFFLNTTQDGFQGNWSGEGVSSNNFDPSGLNGIVILTFTPDAGQCAGEVTTDINVDQLVPLSISGIPDSLCQFNTSISLPNIQTGFSGNWSGPGVSNNTFNPAGLNGNIILTFTPDADICASPANTLIAVFQNLYIISGIPQSVCVTEPSVQLPPLQNGISGNWSGLGVTNNTFNPSGQNGTVSLVFTPDAGQCATVQSQNIIINALVIPSITGIPNSLCETSFPITLLAVQNSITGSWSGPGVSLNTFNPSGLSGNVILLFTPDAGQCALSNTTTISVDTVIVPVITGLPTFVCEIGPSQFLPTTQNNMNGNWSGQGVSNNSFDPVGLTGIVTLTFTPDDGQCSASAQWDISINPSSIPLISNLPAIICQTDSSIGLPTIQSGYSGNWSGPGIISNTFYPSGLNGTINLFFNPDLGQCANVALANITVESAVMPLISGIPDTLCEYNASINLQNIQDGIVGNWSGPGVAENIFNPSGQNGNITLNFVPNAEQCAIQATTSIFVSTVSIPGIIGIPPSLCQDGSPLHLPESLSGLEGNWSGQNITSNVFEPKGLEGNYILTFTPFKGQCAIPSTTQITVNPSPHFINLYTECDTISQTYHVAFDIIGGDPTSYTVNGSPVGGSAFISSPFIADSTNYFFTLDDANGCGPVFIEGSVNCACATYAGTMNYHGTPLKLCEGADFTVPFNGDAKLDTDDLSALVLHDNAGTLLGTIYAISNNTTFTFPSGIVLGQIYFISPIAGSNNGHGNIDLNDPCLSVSQGIPVIFYHPQVMISHGGIICIDDCITYTFQLSGEKPYEMEYKVIANGMQTDQLLITDTNKVDIVICPQDFGITDGVIDIVPSSLTDANCTVDLTPFTGLQTIVRPASSVFISEILCSGESLTLNGTVYDQFNPSGTQTIQNVEGCDSIIEIQLAFYPEAIHEINQTICYGASLIVNNNVYNESHPHGTEILPGKSMNGCDSIIEINLEFDSVVMSNLHTTLCSGESIEINGNTYDEAHPEGNETFPGGSVLGCDSIVNIKLSFYPAALSSLNPLLCKGDMVIINGTVYDENHTTGNEVLKNGSVFGCDSVIQVALTFMPEAYEFITDTLEAGESIIVNGNIYDQSHSQGIEILYDSSIYGCDSTIEIVLYFRKALSVLTEAVGPVCHGDSTGEIVVKEINGGIPPYEVSVDGGSQMTISFLPVILSGLFAGNHQVILTDATSNKLVIEVEVSDTPALEVNAGMDLSIKDGEDVSLIAKASFPVATWLWTPADFLSCIDCPDPLIEKPDHNVTYTILATDQNGCKTLDEVVLTIRYEDEIYIPTVFSPNGDGVNDTWRIYSSDHQAKLVSLSILDRWGGVLFNCVDRSLDDSGVEWDGSMKWTEMSPGVYVFIAVVENGDGKIIRLQGDITLIK